MKGARVALPAVLALLFAAPLLSPRVRGYLHDVFMDGPGTFCRDDAFECASDKEALRCVDDRFEAFPCNGPKGCSLDESGPIHYLRCDLSANEEGERCFSAEGKRTEGNCSADKREMVVCVDGKIHRTPCRGQDGCRETPIFRDQVWCDTTSAAVDDACSMEGDIACSVPHDERLVCREGKFVVEVPCKGPLKCRVERTDGKKVPFIRLGPPKEGEVQIACDALGEVGDPCALDASSAVCSVEHDAVLECREGKLAVRSYCRGPKGCSVQQDNLTCDTDFARVGDPCTGPGAACDVDRKHRLECKDGRFVVEVACACAVRNDEVVCE